MADADMTETPNSKSLMATTSLSALARSITPAERAAGRFMRAPDHGEGDQGGADAGDADKGADADQNADADKGGDVDANKDADADADKSLMNADGKADADKDEKAEGEEKAEPEGPPETYTLTPPEGMEIDDALLAEVTPVFKELGLSDAQANKLMPLAGTFAERLFARQQDAFQTQATGWAKDAKADPEVGGKNWPRTEALVASALDTFAGPKSTKEVPNAFRDLLDVTKLGSHPEMIRMFRKIGEKLGEGGGFIRPDAGAQIRQPREAVLYPNDVPQKASA